MSRCCLRKCAPRLIKNIIGLACPPRPLGTSAICVASAEADGLMGRSICTSFGHEGASCKFVGVCMLCRLVCLSRRLS